VNAGGFFSFDYGGVMVAFGIHFAGCFQHPLRTEMNAELASFAAIRDQVNLPLRDVDFINVERLAIENLHNTVLSISSTAVFPMYAVYSLYNSHQKGQPLQNCNFYQIKLVG
jgi:hypothetical protein